MPEAVSQVWSRPPTVTGRWSLSVVLSEGLSIYEALTQGEDVRLGPPRPYREYISWLRAQDLTATEKYWRRL